MPRYVHSFCTLSTFHHSTGNRIFCSQTAHAVFQEDKDMMQGRTEAGQVRELLLHNFSNPENGCGLSTSDSRVTFMLLFSTLTVACSAFAAGSTVAYSSPVEYEIIADLGISLAEYSVFGSIWVIGGIIGAIVSGRITDLIGRKRTIWVLDIFYITGWLAIAVAKEVWLLDIGRLLLGIGSSMSSYLVPVYVAEITPKNVRGGLLSATQLMTIFSIAFTFIIGSLINWRILALIGAIPSVVQVILAFFIPDSPRWLAKIDREEEFEAALLCLRGKNADISQEAAEIKEYTKAMDCMSKEGVLDLFQLKYAYPCTVGIGLLVLQQFAGINAYTLYMSAIFVSAGISITVGFISVAVFEIIVSILAIMFMDKCGRRPLLMVSVAGTCLGSFLTGLSLFLQEIHRWREATHIWALIGVLVYLGSYALGSGIPWIMISEIFPINIKGSAGSICNLINSLSSLVVAYSFQFLLEWNPAGTFFIFASVSGVAVLFVAKLVPETKGRTLEEIQESVIHFWQQDQS